MGQGGNHDGVGVRDAVVCGTSHLGLHDIVAEGCAKGLLDAFDVAPFGQRKRRTHRNAQRGRISQHTRPMVGRSGRDECSGKAFECACDRPRFPGGASRLERLALMGERSAGASCC